MWLLHMCASWWRCWNDIYVALRGSSYFPPLTTSLELSRVECQWDRGNTDTHTANPPWVGCEAGWTDPWRSAVGIFQIAMLWTWLQWNSWSFRIPGWLSWDCTAARSPLLFSHVEVFSTCKHAAVLLFSAPGVNADFCLHVQDICLANEDGRGVGIQCLYITNIYSFLLSPYPLNTAFPIILYTLYIPFLKMLLVLVHCFS